jgi:hypothetical protein
MKNLSKGIVLLLCGAALALAGSRANAQADRKFSFAVVPQYSSTDLHKEWAPLLHRISRDAGIELELRIAASIPKFEGEFLKGLPDFTFRRDQTTACRPPPGSRTCPQTTRPDEGIAKDSLRNAANSHDESGFWRQAEFFVTQTAAAALNTL